MDEEGRKTYMLPPRSLICKVTTAEPIQIMAKTPEKTAASCSSRAPRARRKLRRRLKRSGPLAHSY
jgi:hypothetical protein